MIKDNSGEEMKTSTKRLGMAILTTLAMVLALVTASAASAVWGS
jgi:hypothetical protein